MTPTLLHSIFYDETIAQQFSDEPFVQYMLRFEIALARVESRMGIIPLEAAKAILSCITDGDDILRQKAALTPEPYEHIYLHAKSRLL